MIYCLNKENVPTIPVPHDCVIKRVSIEQNFIAFIFEDNISTRDTIKCIRPNASSLILKIHLIDSFDTYKMKGRKRPWCKSTYARIDNKRLERIAEKGRLEYLYHYVGYQSIIIKLFCETYIVLDLQGDYIEYEWIEEIPISSGERKIGSCEGQLSNVTAGACSRRVSPSPSSRLDNSDLFIWQ